MLRFVALFLIVMVSFSSLAFFCAAYLEPSSLSVRSSYSRGILSVYYLSGWNVVFRVDGGDWISDKAPITIYVDAYNVTYEVDGVRMFSPVPFSVIINSTNYVFKIISPEEHSVEVKPYSWYKARQNLMNLGVLVVCILLLSILIIVPLKFEKLEDRDTNPGRELIGHKRK